LDNLPPVFGIKANIALGASISFLFIGFASFISNGMRFFTGRSFARWFAAMLLVFFVVGHARGAAELDAARINEIASFLPAHAVGVGQPAVLRAEWDKIAARPNFQNWLEVSRKQLLEPLVEVSDDLFISSAKSGDRDSWQGVEFSRRTKMELLALAECLENKGAFLPALEAAIQAICAERTWVYSAHDRNLQNFYGKATNIDLGSSAVAWDLGTIDFLLADQLSAETRKLIRDNLERRIFEPYREMVTGRRPEDGWLRRKNNWNAVCLAGVTGAALAVIDSPRERAWYIASAQYYIRNFLNGFTADGYCNEGLSYWNYGFGHFILLTETVREVTDGRVDFLADPAAYWPALFSRRVELLNGIYPSISDTHTTVQPDLAISTYICRRFVLTPCAEGNEMFQTISGKLFSTALFLFLPDELPRLPHPATVKESPLRSWFPEGGLLICRPAPPAKIPFAVSFKGGNNNESHNHNDLGSFIVLSGGSTVVCDPGAEVYTGRTFGPKRYESDLLNSFGHSVPVIAGQLQRAGAAAIARVVRTNFTEARDTLTLDLKSAYAVPTLQRLERTFVFRRDQLALSVRDDVQFSKPETFETALVTWGEWKKIGANEFSITDEKGAARVKIDTGGRPFEIKTKPLEADARTPKKASHIGIVLKEPVTKATVILTITPQL